ncbi:MAG: hypothetical protein ACRDQF_16175, partial [Thermocrispum sp.]
IDAGGVLPTFTGVLVRDGYNGYTHLPAIHAWCGAQYAAAAVMRTGRRVVRVSSCVGGLR